MSGSGVPPDVFDDDYDHFYGQTLEERSDAEVELIANLLSLRPGMRVLDIPCGEGRIAGRLAKRGGDLVGIDASERFVGRARERYPDVRFEHGDMRDLAYEAEFDAVVNWFSSFGYFKPHENDAVLAGLARSLRPGGRLVLEQLNPGRLARLVELGGGTAAMVLERDSDLLVDRTSYDSAEGRSRTERFIVRGGHVRKVEFSVEQVPAPQLVERLKRAGFAEVELLGKDGTPFDPEGPRLIALARRG